MSKTKEQKKTIIGDLKEKLSRQKSAIFVDFQGLESKKLFQLRNELKKSDGGLAVVKKTLLRKVLGSLKQENFLKAVEGVEGQLALALGFGDEILPAKLCYKFSEENEALKILGGVLGKEVLSKEKIVELAKIPAREVLLAKLVGSIYAPVSNFVYVLQSNIKGLITVLSKMKH